LSPSKNITKKHISDKPDVFPCIPSVQLRALKTNTYQNIVKTRGIIKISLSIIIRERVSSSIIPQNILLTYHIFIEVIPIVAPIIIWSIKRVFALRETISSKKLTRLITNQNTKIRPSLKSNCTNNPLKTLKAIKNTIPTLYGIGFLFFQYFLGLSSMSNF